MSKILPFILLSFISGTGVSKACSTQFKELDLNAIFYKQFPDDDILYSPRNRSHRGWSQYLSKSIHGTRKIVLTFDDGPHPIRTPRLLDILKKYNAKATFFTMGALIEKYPQIAQRIVDEGHILAGHDWTHDNSNDEDEDTFAKGLRETVIMVKKFNDQNNMYYRFPYGAYASSKLNYHHLNTMKDVSKDLFGKNCINFAFWDIDTADWVNNMKPKDIVQNIHAHLDGGFGFRHKKVVRNGRTTYVKEEYPISNPPGGGVILMHDIHKRTVDAMELFLKKAKSNNIEIISLTTVKEFSYSNKNCQLL